MNYYYLCFCCSVADDYERHANEALKDSSFIGNPVNAFLLVKRFTNDWHKIQEVIKSNGAEGKWG